MADTPMHSVSVAGIVVDDQDRVLVIQRRDNGHWEPPGGVLELAETPEDGVKREVLEETGISIRVEQLSGIYKNMQRSIIALVFRCTPIGGLARTTEESQRVTWLPRERVAASMDEAYSVRVLDAFDTDVKLRSHDGVSVIV